MPSQEANPNPASAPAPAPTSQTPKKGGGLIKALIGVFAVAIIGFGGWYAYDSGLFGDSDDVPPALSLGGGQFQGKSVETTFGFLQFDSGDAYEGTSNPTFKNAQKGVSYFYPKTNMSFDAIVKSINPKDDLKILVAFYNAEEPWAGNTTSSDIKLGCFEVYPVGPYENTCEVAESELSTTSIAKGRGFAIIASDSYEYDSNMIADAKTLSASLTIPQFNGWTMHPLAQTMDLSDRRIKSIWAQKNTNEFEKITNPESLTNTREFKMAWLKLGEATTGDYDSTQDNTDAGNVVAPPICGDGNVDTGEACDDGTANSDTVADACRTTCVAASCGDGVVDSDEECDGTADCEADCTLTSVAPVCGNGEVEEGEVCDDGNEVDTDACSNDCQTQRSMVDMSDRLTDAQKDVLKDGVKDASAVKDTSKVEMLLDNDKFSALDDTSKTTPDEDSSAGTFKFAPLAITDMKMLAPLTSISYVDNLGLATINGKNLTLNFTRYGDLYTARDHDQLIAQAVAAIKITPQGDDRYYTLGNINIKTEGNFLLDDGTSTILTDNFCAGTGAWRAILLYEDSDGTVKEEILFEDVNKDGLFNYGDLNENKGTETLDPGKEYILVITMNDINCGFSSDAQLYSHTMITSLDLQNPDGDKVTYDEAQFTNDLEFDFINWTE